MSGKNCPRGLHFPWRLNWFLQLSLSYLPSAIKSSWKGCESNKTVQLAKLQASMSGKNCPRGLHFTYLPAVFNKVFVNGAKVIKICRISHVVGCSSFIHVLLIIIWSVKEMFASAPDFIHSLVQGTMAINTVWNMERVKFKLRYPMPGRHRVSCMHWHI